jgi:hypothetical protein
MRETGISFKQIYKLIQVKNLYKLKIRYSIGISTWF